MFSRGNWSILGLEKGTAPLFTASLNNPHTMLGHSQLAAYAAVLDDSGETFGINPFLRPRLDEDVKYDIAELVQPLSEFRLLKGDARAQAGEKLLEDETVIRGFRYGSAAFRLTPDFPLFALWFVFNELKDVGDVASVREDVAYRAMGKPYKFLSAGDKKTVEIEAKTIAAKARKQFPVLLDFEGGKVYAETTNKELIAALRIVLDHLGALTYDVAWKFEDGDWIRDFLAHMVENSSYKAEIKKRATESINFRSDEIEKLDEPEVEKIVHDFFAMTPVEPEGWVGLKAPAGVRLYPNTRSVTAPTSPTTTLLLNASDKASVTNASIEFQERIVLTNKKGEEKIIRNTLFTLDLCDGLNDVEAGTAILKGFDMPGFKREIQRTIRKTKQVPDLTSFWLDWLIQMKRVVNDFTVTMQIALDIDGDAKIGIQKLYEQTGSDDVLENQLENPARRPFREALKESIQELTKNGTLTVTFSPALGTDAEDDTELDTEDGD